MPNDTKKFVIVKLRTGDELVAELLREGDGYFQLYRPLQMQRSTIFDTHSSKIKKNICVFRDWLEFTTRLECPIKNEDILLLSDAGPDIIKKYLEELEYLDTGSKTKVAPVPKKPLDDKEVEEIEREANEMLMREAMRLLNGTPPAKQQGDTGSFINQTNLGQNVTATFSMPPDVFLNIVLNMPMFDGWGQEMPDDGEDFGNDDDSEDEPKKPNPPPSPSRKAPKKKPDPNSEDEPPKGWNGRFGFPK